MHKTPEITRIIHENFLVVITFAFAQPQICDLLDERFHGEFRYLRESVGNLAEIRADRALFEMGLELRALDDEEDISDKEEGQSFGALYDCGGRFKVLGFRDMANKIIHAESFEWDFQNRQVPKVICIAQEKQRERYNWDRAEINLVDLAAFMGMLAYQPPV
jgi:hypothetical protein